MRGTNVSTRSLEQQGPRGRRGEFKGTGQVMSVDRSTAYMSARLIMHSAGERQTLSPGKP